MREKWTWIFAISDFEFSGIPAKVALRMQPGRPILLGLLLLALGRLILAYSFDLSPEEAYWAGAGDRLVPYTPLGGVVPAFLAKAGTLLLGASEVGVRLPVLLLGVASAWAFFSLVRSAIDGGTAVWATIAVAVIPLVHLGSTMMLAPALAVHFGVIGVFFLWKGILRSSGLGWWLASGLAFGLSVLSHPLGLLFLLGAALALLGLRRWRARWRAAGPWLMTAAILLLVLPVLVWFFSSERGGVVWTALLERFRSGEGSSLLGRVWVAMLGFTPLFLLGAFVGGFGKIRSYLEGKDHGSTFLLLQAVPCLLVGLALAWESRDGALWLTPGVLFGVALLGEQWPLRAATRGIRVGLRTLALGLGLVFCLAVSMPDLVRGLGLPLRGASEKEGGWKDPSLSCRGWRTAGEHVREVATAAEGELGKRGLLLLADEWRMAAELEFYLRGGVTVAQPDSGHPVVHPLPSYQEPGSYAAWSSYASFAGRGKGDFFGLDALYVTEESAQEEVPEGLVRSFDEVRPVSEVLIRHGRVPVRRLTVYACFGYRGERLP